MQKSISLLLKLLVIFYLFSFFPSFADPCDPADHHIYGGYTDFDGSQIGDNPPVWIYDSIDFYGSYDNEMAMQITFVFNETTGNTQQQAQDIINGGPGTLVEFYWEVIEGKSYAIICHVYV